MTVVLAFALAIMIMLLRKVNGVLREAQRMDSVYRGPIHSTFTNIVSGLVSLRTYERLEYFREQFIDSLEKSCNITFTMFAANRWMGLNLDFCILLFNCFTTIFTLIAKGKLKDEYLAFTL
jgi:hypothetical protein